MRRREKQQTAEQPFIVNRKALIKLIPAACFLLVLAGCWTPPNANVQPPGHARLIQGGIETLPVKEAATVTSVTNSDRTLALEFSNGQSWDFKVDPKVENLDHVKAGDRVKVTVTKELAVYVLENGRLPDGTTAEKLGVNAKVLQVDPSYRILTLQYTNGRLEKIKPALGTQMQQMAPGDSVAVRFGQLTAIHIDKK